MVLHELHGGNGGNLRSAGRAVLVGSLLGILLSAGCGGPSSTVVTARPASLPTSAAGSTPTWSWDEMHQLIDDFDLARYGHDDSARHRVRSALRVEGAATDAVVDALLAALAQTRDAPADARLLLDQDRHPPAGRGAIFARMNALKGVARGNGPLAANATLRLWGFCAQAFRDAVKAPARDRAIMLSNCLYPLYDADPAPFFAVDPVRRQPPPAWKDLRADLDVLGDRLAAQSGRLAPLAPMLRAELTTLVNDAEAKNFLPRAHDPKAQRVPIVAIARPFDGEPLAFVNGMPLVDFQLAPLLEEDRRGRFVLSLTADEPAENFLRAAEEAHAAGADEVALAVGYDAVVESAPASYWHVHAPAGHVMRLGILPLAIGTQSRAWQPARAGLSLRLLVGARRWHLVSPSGAFPSIAVGEDVGPAVDELRAQLADIRSAFPDEDALIVTPEPSVTIEALAAALAACAWSADKTPSVSTLALDPVTPPTGNGNLAERAHRRASIQATISPASLAPHVAAVRRCAQDAAEHGVHVGGKLLVDKDDHGVHVTRAGGKPANPELDRCIADRLAGAMPAASRAEVAITE